MSISKNASVKPHFRLQNLESYNRIANIPIVNRGFIYAEDVYRKVKTMNNLLCWTLDQAEESLKLVVDTTTPVVVLFQGPISGIDKLICTSLDIAEDTVPSINLPPEMIYSNTKQYITEVSSKIVRPVLRRADSVKHIGNTVLSSKYTEYAANRLDDALYVADAYVDKYLPPEKYDDPNVLDNDEEDNNTDGKALHTIHHVDIFSRKLQRRLTKRTIQEAKAIKEQSAEAMHILLYVVELIATDPKLAFQKGKELWENLSKNEPENQARPENLEQLMVILVRESARRIVHFINYSSVILAKVPRYAANTTQTTTSIVLSLADSVVKSAHLEEAEEYFIKVLKIQAHTATILLKEINTLVSQKLEQFAEDLSTTTSKTSGLAVPAIDVNLKAASKKPTKHVPSPKIIPHNTNASNSVTDAKIGNSKSSSIPVNASSSTTSNGLENNS